MVYFGALLALGMMITGSTNTLSTKAADQFDTIDRYGNTVQFNHPFVQAACMFIGEMMNLIPFFILRARAGGEEKAKGQDKKPFNLLWLALPALCDLTATSTMYVGLGLTDASIFQMLRGSVVVFTAIFSVVFLKRKQYAHHWLGVAFVLVGTAIVGAQGLVCGSSGGSDSSSGRAMVGNILIVAAQVIVAVQMVLEEKLIGDADLHPMQVVGMEGLFGFSFLSIILVVMYFVPAPSFLCTTAPHCEHFEDTYDAFVNMEHSMPLVLALAGNLLSIAFFNAFGVAITKYINAATRMVIDSLRTMVIWGVSLWIGWESFCWVEVIGFVILLIGTLTYNSILKIPGLTYPDAEVKGERLLDDEDGEFGQGGDAWDGAGRVAAGRGGAYGKLEADI